MGKALWVGLGGFCGAVLRYGVGGLIYRLAPFAAFPYATLIVNAAGCLAIGLVAGRVEQQQALGPNLRLFLLIGVIGGFTTFSTFGLETFALARDREIAKAVGNVALHLVLGLGAVWAGYALSRLG